MKKQNKHGKGYIGGGGRSCALARWLARILLLKLSQEGIEKYVKLIWKYIEHVFEMYCERIEDDCNMSRD